MSKLKLSSIYSFALFFHENDLSSTYCYKTDINTFIDSVKNDEVFCSLMSKISKKYILEDWDFDINDLLSAKDKREYMKIRTVCLKNTLSKEAKDEIKRIYEDFEIVTDKNMLSIIERILDINDLTLIVKSLCELDMMPKNFISDFDIDVKKFEEKNEDYFYHTALKIYYTDKYYFFKPYGFSDTFLQSQRLKNVYFHIICD